MDYGVILDLETTGVDAQKDKIIEIGLLEFGVGLSGKPQISNLYGALEDPGEPLSEEIVKLTGLTDEILAGQRINWDSVRSILERASIVIAHNANFDRAFCEAREELKGLDLHWGCSQRHIDWEAKGFRTKALNYLAADHGFVNPFAHRALFDCATTFRVVEPYFEELLGRSYLNELRIWATGAAFETKDKLRLARYRWDPSARVWFKDIMEDTLEQERLFLRAQIYPEGRDTHRVETLKIVRTEVVVEELRD
jgi:DNA polymerase-3 subunit epsilon